MLGLGDLPSAQILGAVVLGPGCSTGSGCDGFRVRRGWCVAGALAGLTDPCLLLPLCDRNGRAVLCRFVPVRQCSDVKNQSVVRGSRPLLRELRRCSDPPIALDKQSRCGKGDVGILWLTRCFKQSSAVDHRLYCYHLLSFFLFDQTHVFIWPRHVVTVLVYIIGKINHGSRHNFHGRSPNVVPILLCGRHLPYPPPPPRATSGPDVCYFVHVSLFFHTCSCYLL